MQKKEVTHALEIYEQCLRISKKSTTLDGLSVFVNKIACLLALEKYERVI